MDTNAALCQHYFEAIFARFQTPLDSGPKGIIPSDQLPSFKAYQQATRLVLPGNILDLAVPLGNVWATSPLTMREHRAMTFEDVTSMLLLTYGILNMRMELIWGKGKEDPLSSPQVKYGRGTASGGGIYPAELYWVGGPCGPVQPGVYHYDPAHHALERLMSGDRTRHIQAALFNHPAALTTDQFLLITLNLRKNTFKYKSFGYHLATQDLGVLLGSFSFMSAYFQTTFQPFLWFQDEALNQILGIDTLAESVFAVLPLALVPSFAREKSLGGSMATKRDEEQEKLPVVRKCIQSPQKPVTRYPIIEEVHQATLIKNALRPAPIVDAIGKEIEHTPTFLPLPPLPSVHLQGNISDIFRRRRSSFGRFSRQKPLSRLDLAALLSWGAAAGYVKTDLKQADGSPNFTRLAVFVNNVENIPPGAYIYDRQRHGLYVIHQGAVASFLQKHYVLENYNLAENAVLMTVIGNPTRLLEAYGGRGLRALNIEAGMVAQTIYLTATALSLGCGAVLGFDNLAINEALGLLGTDLRSLLFIMAGSERQNNACFNSSFPI